MSEINTCEIDGHRVHGLAIDEQTRCVHWHSPLDVVAIRFACCREFYSCYECHAVLAGHDAVKSPVHGSQTDVVLCGVCGATLSVAEYLKCGYRCPRCNSEFNPGCYRHVHLYFD